MDMRTLLSAQGFDTDSLSDDQLAVYHTLFRRRDVRREFAGEVVDRERLMRVLAAAHAAPSVGLSQPWDFNPIQSEGIVDSGTGIVVTYDPTRGGKNILGRDTVDDTGLMSVALAIQNLWLAATAEGLGVGWVSFYHEDFLADFVGVEAPVRPVAWLCIGPVTHLAEERDLEKFGWRKGLALDEVVHWG